MSNLVDPRPERSPQRIWIQRIGTTLGVVALGALIVWTAMHLSRAGKAPARQVAKIALLPDTPPPPPPPPPEKPKVEPKTEVKQQIEKQKVETPPEPQQVKMEGPAGEGPSPFTAGEVKNDYIGGEVGNGAVFASYVGRVAQLIQEELSRRKGKLGSARVLLWLNPDGAVERFEVRGAAADTERQIRTAMADLKRVPEGPPQGMPMPMGLEISQQ
jgi:hypothetical protein